NPVTSDPWVDLEDDRIEFHKQIRHEAVPILP
ncbi:unnamed protein product, partial [marine sediment metagenome]